MLLLLLCHKEGKQRKMTDKILIALIGSPVLTVIVTEAIRTAKRLFDKKKNKGFAKFEKDLAEIQQQTVTILADLNASKETEKVLLHDRIWQAFRYLSGKEEIGVEDRANIDYLYEEYKKKGGNHKAKVMYEYIKTIPVIPKEEEE